MPAPSPQRQSRLAEAARRSRYEAVALYTAAADYMDHSAKGILWVLSSIAVAFIACAAMLGTSWWILLPSAFLGGYFLPDIARDPARRLYRLAARAEEAARDFDRLAREAGGAPSESTSDAPEDSPS